MEKEISYPYNVISFSLYVSTFFPYQLAIFFFFSKKHDFILLNLTVKLCSTVSVQTISTCPRLLPFRLHHHAYFQPSLPAIHTALYRKPPSFSPCPLSVCLSVAKHVCWGFPCNSPFPKTDTCATPLTPLWRRRSLLGKAKEKNCVLTKGSWREKERGRKKQRYSVMPWDAVSFVYLNGSKETAYNSLLVVWSDASHHL